jgi:hypothetical protein
VLNVSTFETFFPEKRPFFTQGLDLFEPVGGGGYTQLMNLFYSRRIGFEAPILAAAKLTGTPIPGLSIGVLDALVTARQPLHAETDDELAGPDGPAINYLAVVGRADVGADSWVGLRLSSATPITDGAQGGNALALDTTLRPRDSDWSLFGQAAVSQVIGGPSHAGCSTAPSLERGEIRLRARTCAGASAAASRGASSSAYDFMSPELELNAIGFQPTATSTARRARIGFHRPNGLGFLHGFDATLSGFRRLVRRWRGLVRERGVAAECPTPLCPASTTSSGALPRTRQLRRARAARERGGAAAPDRFEVHAAGARRPTPGRVVSVNALTALGHHMAAGPSPGRFDWTLGGGFVLRPSAAFETRLDVTGDRTLFSPRYIATLDEGRSCSGARLFAVHRDLPPAMGGDARLHAAGLPPALQRVRRLRPVLRGDRHPRGPADPARARRGGRADDATRTSTPPSSRST